MTDSHTSCCTTLIPLFHTEDFKEIFLWYLVYLINISLYPIIVFASRRALTVLQKLCSLVDYRHLYCMVSNSDGNIFCLITSMIVMIKKNYIYIYTRFVILNPFAHISIRVVLQLYDHLGINH